MSSPCSSKSRSPSGQPCPYLQTNSLQLEFYLIFHSKRSASGLLKLQYSLFFFSGALTNLAISFLSIFYWLERHRSLSTPLQPIFSLCCSFRFSLVQLKNISFHVNDHYQIDVLVVLIIYTGALKFHLLSLRRLLG